MQLTKDDLVTILQCKKCKSILSRPERCKVCGEDKIEIIILINFLKVQQVVAFYDHCILHEGIITVEEKEKLEHLYLLWTAKVYAQEPVEDFDKYLFSYCFKDGLK